MQRLTWLAFVLLGLTFGSGFDNYADAQFKKKKPPLNDNDPKHLPENAVKNLDVHKDLEATLFASEPKITNPTNLDIDHRGRVWICDVQNYRGNQKTRPEGDRILILEDTDGDGVADKVTTFYQGKDVDSAMGIGVFGNKVIVSCSPNVLVFTFDENDKITKKEYLFTKTGQPQHDHSAHSFVFGPDGRLYWNFGNTGGAVRDKNGKQVIDLAGNAVVDNGKPYFGGMVFRCDMDGGNFETLGHNFRNNYEVAVDSFGTLWQSDNDDDGNRGVRINYVMEYGNFGYRDEMTGAGWQSKRTNMEKEIPLRHWHLNDPGVVPNLLQTYQGSPTGICVYEGTLLPRVFQNQMIHCDAGPSIVRAYPVTPDGAGYKASIVNILDGNKKNNWFRPADVCTAPDGSIFVTDWYDPGVGGHGQRDLNRGRVFRVAPPGVKYKVPKVKFDTIEDNIEALKNPNLAVRYLAWTNLHKAGVKAEPALLKLFDSKVPHERARALWLLGRLDGKGSHYVDTALKDADPNIRIVGVRLARQLKFDVKSMTESIRAEMSPAVRREWAISLHNQKERGLWGWPRAHDGKDRWYLEALGIGADGDWDRCMNAYFLFSPNAPIDISMRDLIWRSRAAKTPEWLAGEIMNIVNQNQPADDLPRLLRAFDFQKDSAIKNEALIKLAFGSYSDPARRNFITTEALFRLKNLDIKKSPQHAAALNKVLDSTKGTATYVDLIGRFSVADRYGELLAIAQNQPGEQLGVDAMRLLLERNPKLAVAGLQHKQITAALATVQAMANAAHANANPLLLPIIQDTKADLELRRQATRALAKTKSGAEELIKLAQAKKLGDELKPAAGSALSTASWKELKGQIAELFPIAPGKDNKPLPPLTDLAKLKGIVANGKLVFAMAGTCAKCHVVNGDGKDIGPNLSEIGKKLGREALFESILYPSASISHNFETWIVETKKGDISKGILVSQTPDEVVIKTDDALTRTFKKGDVESITKSPVSLMPADLHKELTSQDLADVVEYMLTLREAKKASK